MEEEICQYSKYGYCKFKDTCKRKHYSEDCRDPQTASRSRPAQRDTLNLAKDMLPEAANSKMNVPTAIRKNPKIKETCEPTNTIDILEKIVREITLKFIKVDQELKYIKEQMKLHGITVNSRVDNSTEEKDVAANNETVKEVAKTYKIENIEANDSKKEFLTCKLCDYKCKKMISLQKHSNTKHLEQIFVTRSLKTQCI